MVNLFKEKLTKYYSLFLTLLNKTKYSNHSSKNARKPYWDRMAMFLFISVMRMRNNRLFSWMGVINTAAHWTSSGGNISVIFGQKVTRDTMVKKLTGLVTPAECERRTIACLSTLLFVKGAFDNTQHFVEQKFQREMVSSLAHMATSSMYILPDIPPLLNSIEFGDLKPKLTYYQQAIPSAFGMPLYHAISQVSPNTFLDDHALGRHDGIDITGKAVEQLAGNIGLANLIYDMHRLFEVDANKKYHYQRDEAHQQMVKLGVFAKLAGCRATKKYGSRTFFSQCYNYQLRETKSWRPEVKKASVIVPPLMPHDETTNIGAAKVILTMLRMVGILKVSDDEFSDGESITDVRKLKLADDWYERTFMLSGDGLSQVRARTLDELISQSAHRYIEHHETRNVLKKALSRIVHVTGDLHGGNFHFLSAVYTVFYGALIQPIQTLLGWKRIRGTDVTKCYQQAAGLAILISDIIKKHLFDEFFISLDNDALKWLDISKIDDPAGFAVALGKAFLAWAEEKQSTTDDELFVMGLNYMKMMEYYKMFRASIRSGDAVSIEWLYKEFLPLFLITGKHNYFEINLGMIENFYNHISNKILHLVRINRCTPIHDGLDKYKNPMANWAQDDLLEHIQPEYHTMPFSHSHHLVAKKRCMKFVQHEFTRVSRKRDYSEMMSDPSVDPAKVRKATSVPRRQPEKDAISEFISKVGMCNEESGRMCCRKKFWSVLDDMDDDLIGNRKLAAMEKEMEMMSDGDRVMASWIDDLFAETKGNDALDITREDTERGAARLLDLFNRVESASGDHRNGSNQDNEIINSATDNREDVRANESTRNDSNCDDGDSSDDDCEMEEDPATVSTEIEFGDIMAIDESVVTNEENGPDAEEDEEGSDRLDKAAETPAYQTQKETYDEMELDVNVAKKRGKVSIRCAKINPLAFRDIMAAGWKKLEKMDLVTTRFAAKEREKRKQEIREEVHDSVVGNANGTDTHATIEGLLRLGIN